MIKFLVDLPVWAQFAPNGRVISVEEAKPLAESVIEIVKKNGERPVAVSICATNGSETWEVFHGKPSYATSANSALARKRALEVFVPEYLRKILSVCAKESEDYMDPFSTAHFIGIPIILKSGGIVGSIGISGKGEKANNWVRLACRSRNFFDPGRIRRN